MNVRRVEDANGSHIEPPLDDAWDDLAKLTWHLAATLHDAGLPQTGMVVRLLTGGTGPLDDFPMYQLGIPGYCIGPLSYTAMWDVINGVEFGVRAARDYELDDLRDELDRAHALVRKLNREALTAEFALEGVRDLVNEYDRQRWCEITVGDVLDALEGAP